jgi:predicted glycosyltransferase involved in capsule biosynthesis
MEKILGIVVPYRDRESHLKEFIPYMKDFLEKIPHKIVIVEQNDEKPFNRAKLMNVGYDFLKDGCDYFCFHDVDLLPIEDANYEYVGCPTHLARLLDYLGWRVHYEELFGGVTMFNKTDFKKVNGFSNEYWGWGGEDDDLRLRCVKEGLNVDKRMNKYKSLPHRPAGPHHPNYENNRNKMRDFRDTPDNNYHKEEGLNTLKYDTILVDNKADHTLLKVML